MSELIKRLEATLRFDTVNGDSFERSIVNSQIREAIAEIKLYKGLLEAEQEDCQSQRKISQTQWERAEVVERECVILNTEIIKLRANAMPGGHGCCDICDTGGCCKAESEEE